MNSYTPSYSVSRTWGPKLAPVGTRVTQTRGPDPELLRHPLEAHGSRGRAETSSAHASAWDDMKGK